MTKKHINDKCKGWQVKPVVLYSDSDLNEYSPEGVYEGADTPELLVDMVASGDIPDASVYWSLYVWDGKVHHIVNDYAEYDHCIAMLRLLSCLDEDELPATMNWDWRYTHAS